MKKQSLKKIITMGLLSASVLLLAPTGASAAWRQDTTGWWNTEGNSYSRGWRNIGGSWYYFRSNGYMATGWVNDWGWYYFSPSGAMQTGWIQSGGVWYYLKPNGVMAIGNVVIDGKESRFDINGKWLGYVSSNQNTNNNQQSGIAANNNQQQAGAGNNSSTVPQNTQTNTSSTQQNSNSNAGTNNTGSNSNSSSQGNSSSNSSQASSSSNANQGSSNSNTNQVNSTSNNSQGNSNNNNNAFVNQSSNSSSTNTVAAGNSNNNQAVTSNQTNGEFSINDALAMIGRYKGVTVTLIAPGPTSGIDGAYEKIHKDGKVGYYITSYLFNGQRVDNSSGILIFEDGDYKQYVQGHHPSDLQADEWITKKEENDALVRDFTNHVQITHDGEYEYYRNGIRHVFYVTGGMEQGMAYRTFHAELFDRNGYYIETAADYIETAHIN